MSQNKITLLMGDLKCVAVPGKVVDRVVYMIYPEVAGMTDGLLDFLASTYNLPIVMVYVPTDQWNNYLTPWPEPGEAKGFPPFAGDAAEFLKKFTQEIIPETDKALGLAANPRRDLMGVSLSGLFTLWTWLQTDVFKSIACLSGSFWYAGFLDWFDNQKIGPKEGEAYFLLGRDEPNASIKAYRTVGVNTEAIVSRLKSKGIATTFQWVAGNHFSDPEGRAKLGFAFLATQG